MLTFCLILLVSAKSNTPLFFVSPFAEEILVYANTVPEWLCAARQEKVNKIFAHFLSLSSRVCK